MMVGKANHTSNEDNLCEQSYGPVFLGKSDVAGVLVSRNGDAFLSHIDTN